MSKVNIKGKSVAIVFAFVLGVLAIALGLQLLVAWGLVTLFNIAFSAAYSTLQAFVVLLVINVIGSAFRARKNG